ncbi:Septation initiation network scaffold protein cdc11 [Smittium culicis]|uniref:Septation initiation network scaffold protein cdc11 n=1 Tax=Smittium culicis TaxID=133412 RepID=A0A1R1XVE6_9FUNG|nr:Septation initiation network scaffold protein cdc11 [Smittium culicis]
MWKIHEGFNKAVEAASSLTKSKKSSEKKKFLAKKKVQDKNSSQKNMLYSEKINKLETTQDPKSPRASSLKNIEILHKNPAADLKEDKTISPSSVLPPTAEALDLPKKLPGEVSMTISNSERPNPTTTTAQPNETNVISEDTFLINPEIPGSSDHFNFDGQLSSIFSPLQIERLFNAEISRQDSTSDDNSIKKILWGNSSISEHNFNNHSPQINIDSPKDDNIDSMINDLNLNPSSIFNKNQHVFADTENFPPMYNNSIPALKNTIRNDSHDSIPSSRKSFKNSDSFNDLPSLPEDNFINSALYSTDPHENLLINNRKKISELAPKASFYSKASFSKTEPDFLLKQKTRSDHSKYRNNDSFENQLSQKMIFLNSASREFEIEKLNRSITDRGHKNYPSTSQSIFSRNPQFDSINESSKLITSSLKLPSPAIAADRLKLKKSIESYNASSLFETKIQRKSLHEKYSRKSEGYKLLNNRIRQKVMPPLPYDQTNALSSREPSILNSRSFISSKKNGSYRSSISNKTSKSVMVLLTPDDFAVPLPERIGDMVLDKEKKQWVNVSQIKPDSRRSSVKAVEENTHYSTVNQPPFDRQVHESNNASSSESIRHYSTTNSKHLLKKSPAKFSPSRLKRFSNNEYTDYTESNEVDYKYIENSDSSENKITYSQQNPPIINGRNSSDSTKNVNESQDFNLIEIYSRPDRMSDYDLPSLKNSKKTGVSGSFNLSKKTLLYPKYSPPELINRSSDSSPNTNSSSNSNSYDRKAPLSDLEIHPPNNSSAFEQNDSKSASDTLMLRLNSWKNEFSDLTSISLKSCGLRNLVGLSSCFPELESLDIDDNKVVSFDGIPSNILFLQARNNWFSLGNEESEPRLSKLLPHLEFIDMSENQVSNLSLFSGLIHLRVLILNRNQISSLKPLKNVRRLTSLSISDNFIKSIDLDPKDISSIEHLNLSNNRIEELHNVDNFLNLKELILESNDISVWSIKKPLEKLVNLRLSGNPRLFRSAGDILDNSTLCNLLPSLKSLFLDGIYIRSVGNPESYPIKHQIKSNPYRISNEFSSSNNSFASAGSNLSSSYDYGLVDSEDNVNKSSSYFDSSNTPRISYSNSSPLKHLSLKGNIKTRNLETKINFENLQNLKSLHITGRKVVLGNSSNKLDYFPGNFAMGLPKLPFLTTLELVGCNINELPNNIGFSLPSLEILDVSVNSNLHTLPTSIKKCRKLTILRCQFTALGCICQDEENSSSSNDNQSYFNKNVHNSEYNVHARGSVEFRKVQAQFQDSRNSTELVASRNWPNKLVGILRGLNRLAELDIRGCPLTRYIYSPLDELSDFIIPKYIPADKYSSYIQPRLASKNNSVPRLNLKINTDINKNLISSSLSPETREAMFSQVESLAACKISNRNSAEIFSANAISLSEPSHNSNKYYGSIYRFENDQSISQLNSKTGNAASNSHYQYQIYGYASDLSIKALEEWARTDEAFEAWISKTIIGKNLVEYRKYYRTQIISALPKLKWLDGIACDHK